MKSWIALALLAVSGFAQAQTTTQTRVLLDSDRGPILVDLDQTRAPITVANFLAYVDAGRYDNMILHRVVKDFVIQGGGYKEDSAPIAKYPDIASERNNGLFNTPGTLSMALSNNANGTPNTASADSEFFVNMGTNTILDPNFTVFGRVVYGMGTLNSINTITVRTNENHLPIRPPVVKRAVRVPAGTFPILELHSGGWFDPAKPGRGFSVEVAKSNDAAGTPLLVAYWYDYFEGKQIWMGGAAPFAWGASSVQVPLLIASGGQFGPGFDPTTVSYDRAWGTLTVKFTACDRATFDYTSAYGNGSFELRRLTLPNNARCDAN